MAATLIHQPAYILHARPHGDTSIVADCFTVDFGRVAVYARGAKAKKKSQLRTLLNPFLPSIISTVGSGSLKTLTSIEAVGPSRSITGRALYCAFYLNELLVRLLPENDPQPDIFNYYKNILEALSDYREESGDAGLEVLLRTFEWLVIQQVGASFSLTHTADSNADVKADCYYRFVVNLGLVESRDSSGATIGASLLRFAAGDLADESTRFDMKIFMRRVLKPLLGAKPLKSKELFR